MRDIFRHALVATLASLGITRFSWWKGLRSIFIALVFVTLVFGARGREAAVIEAWDIFWLAVALGCAFFATFLANLWLAPYKILNERLDKVSDAQTPLKAVGEETERARAEGAQRARLASKTNKATREIVDLRICIKRRNANEKFEALKEKYSSWFLPDMEALDMYNWAGRIVATLEINDYDVAEKRIMTAVGKKSWEENRDE